MSGALATAATAAATASIQVPVHRLNRAEYGNAVRDLLAVDIDVEEMLPADPSVHGFDNNADALSFTPTVLDRYVAAARAVSRAAVESTNIEKSVTTYEIPKGMRQDDQTSEDLPIGSRGGLAVRRHFPVSGEYIARVQFRGGSQPQPLLILLDGRNVAPADLVTPPPPAGETARRDVWGSREVRFHAEAGTRTFGVTFVKQRVAMADIGPDIIPVDFLHQMEQLKIATLTIEGPVAVTAPGETASRRKVFACRPRSPRGEEACTARILRPLVRQAYRRPVTDRDLEPLLGFARAARAEGGFEAGVQRAVERLLVDPRFLYRFERKAQAAAPVDDLGLASRLSFFLWSSLPDEELLRLAEKGRLRDDKVLAAQVARMMRDPRSGALIDNFGEQWLYLRNLKIVEPNPLYFPDFEENVRAGLRQETRLFLADQIRNDRPIADLLTADYTFLNETLARFYGVPGVYGERFRRVTLADPKRRGLLGQGSILTVTSYGNRTSPVLRGKWVLENLLGQHVPPPPANVPALTEPEQAPKLTTLRQTLEAHRANPVCASCHRLMDPIGFSLENFDAVGIWRSNDRGAPINSTDMLFADRLDGAGGLRAYLVDKKQDAFAENVLAKLMLYARGRELKDAERAEVRKILQAAKPGGYRWSDLILGVVRSESFQAALIERANQRIAGRDGAPAGTGNP